MKLKWILWLSSVGFLSLAILLAMLHQDNAGLLVLGTSIGTSFSAVISSLVMK